MTGRGWSGAVVTAAVALCAWSSAAWACSPDDGPWSFDTFTVNESRCVRVGLAAEDTGDARLSLLTFENGCDIEVEVDASSCPECECVGGCEEPVSIESGGRAEVNLSGAYYDGPGGTTYPLRLSSDTFEYAFDLRHADEFVCDEYQPDQGGSDADEPEGCSSAGSPARGAPWSALLVALGLVGWRRRRR